MKNLAPSTFAATALATLASVGVVSLAVFPSPVLAASAGPNNPGIVNNIFSSGGDHQWSNASNAKTSDNAYATSDLTNSGNPSYYLEATSTGFSIPPGATITGITVTIKRHQACDTSCTSSVLTDRTVQLIKNGVLVGSNLASSTSWGTSDFTAIYGGSSSLWGTSWTPSDINNSSFGVVLQVQRSSNGDRTAYVDAFSFTVTYTLPLATPAYSGLSSKTITYGDTDVIEKAEQTITFPPIADQIFGTTFAPPVSADSGLPVTLTSNTPAICTVSGGTVHVIGLVGQSCSLTASQAGNNNYNAAASVSQSFSVLPYGVNTTLPPLTISKADFQKMSTIPVKFTIYNGATPVSWAHATLMINGTPAISSGGSNSGNSFRYDTSGQLYIFNLSTKMSVFSKWSNYTLLISLDDGEHITQTITIK